jgi:hypothetical protein
VANRSLKLEDFADHELLYALEEHADADGTISSSELADALGLAGLEHPTNNVSSRLAWLKRYGIVYRDEDTKRWGFTPVGMNLMHGRLTAAQTRMLDNLDPDMLLILVQQVGGKLVTSHREAATMAAREWRYNLAARRRAHPEEAPKTKANTNGSGAKPKGRRATSTKVA